MLPLPRILPPLARRRCCILSGLGALVLCAGQAGALPPAQAADVPGVVLAQAQPGVQGRPAQRAQGDEQAAPIGLEDLNEVLAATQAKLQELFEATAALAEQRAAYEATRQENDQLPPLS